MYLDAALLAERLPGISESAKIFAGVDVTKEPIPVIPTVDYNMGGIPTNFHGEVVTKKGKNPDEVVPGLMAVGEAACVSVHGSNRLGSNSLIDLVVFGRAAALRCAETIKPGAPHAALPADSAALSLSRLDHFRNAKGSTPTAKLRDDMQEAMQSNCAVFRSSEILEEGLEKIQKVWDGGDDIQTTDRGLIWNTDLIETMEYDNLIGLAAVTMVSAENRKESRGAHAHEDFATRDDKNWMHHTLAFADDGKKKVKLDKRPVHKYTMTDEVSYIKPRARVY
ncbi:MAG: hypothetical protein COC23_06675 [Hyphomicrobiales bacterium]|nr:MAG: hypothetical protein COC23_06675 [Hyphomicrobiales bacterium]